MNWLAIVWNHYRVVFFIIILMVYFSNIIVEGGTLE